LKKLSDTGARIAVVAHLGRPKGEVNDEFSLAPVAERLGELLEKQVVFAADTAGESAKEAIAGLEDGQIALLENLRFNPGETSKDEAGRGAIGRELAALGGLFVPRGFGAVLRKQASVSDVD